MRIGPPRKTVVFLESGAGGPPIREKDPDLEMPTGLEGMVVWPRLLIFLHFALAGILFCFWRFPIFGRPREPERDSPSDFGTHIQAVAELLAQFRRPELRTVSIEPFPRDDRRWNEERRRNKTQGNKTQRKRTRSTKTRDSAAP